MNTLFTPQEFAVAMVAIITVIAFLSSAWVVREIVRFCAGEMGKVDRS
jgi:hypothetical protein